MAQVQRRLVQSENQIIAPTKGLGPWDIQSTIGVTLPTSGTSVLGRALLLNTLLWMATLIAIIYGRGWGLPW